MNSGTVFRTSPIINRAVWHLSQGLSVHPIEAALPEVRKIAIVLRLGEARSHIEADDIDLYGGHCRDDIRDSLE
jgi:hypothetical protein